MWASWKYQYILEYGVIVLYFRVISCDGLYKRGCFSLPVVMANSEHTFPPRPAYNYRLEDIPAKVQITLNCTRETDSINIHYAKYLFPRFTKDYCLDRNQGCSDIKPCFCCTKPESVVCSQQLERHEDYCVGKNGSCIMDIPQVYLSNTDDCIAYKCEHDGKNWCVSRWIEIHYTCTTDGMSVQRNNVPHSLKLFRLNESPKAWGNVSMKGQPDQNDNEDMATTMTDDGMSVQRNNVPHSLKLFRLNESPKAWGNVSMKGQPDQNDNEDMATTMTDDSMTSSSIRILASSITGTNMTNYLIITSVCGFITIGAIIIVILFFKYKKRCKRKKDRSDSTGGILIAESDPISSVDVDDSGYEICIGELRRSTANYEEKIECNSGNIRSQHMTESAFLMPFNHQNLVVKDCSQSRKASTGDKLIQQSIQNSEVDDFGYEICEMPPSTANYEEIPLVEIQEKNIPIQLTTKSDYLALVNPKYLDVEDRSQQPCPQDVTTSDYLTPLNNCNVLTSDYLTSSSILEVIDHVQRPHCHHYESVTQKAQVDNNNTESDKEYQQLF